VRFRSDFPDFYTIKSLREGDFGVKIIFFIFRGSFGAAKFLTCMLCLILRSAVHSKLGCPRNSAETEFRLFFLLPSIPYSVRNWLQFRRNSAEFRARVRARIIP
jgi:hypothetical protein